MFDFELEGGSHTSVYYTEDRGLVFNPPVHEQRHCMVLRILEHDLFKGRIKKLVDFGCAQMQLVPLLKRVPWIENILEVDIDESLLRAHSYQGRPLLSDYLDRRKTNFRVDIYKGSISSSVNCLRDVEAVIGIEIIEHLYPDVLENVPYNVFGFIQPKLVVFTTPNSDYNVLFNLTLPNGFRHDDHKFEWSREQFRDWCYNICDRFPNYQVAFLGAGAQPEGIDDVGPVSQIGVFVRNDMRGLPLVEDISAEPIKLPESEEYELLYSYEFPKSVDQRTNREVLLDNVKYHIFRHMNMKNRFYNDEFDRYEIPLGNIFSFVNSMVYTPEELRDFLIKEGYRLDSDDRILVDEIYESQESDGSSDTSDKLQNRQADNTVGHDSDENWD
ncbi:small RNA 2'-O-methyltransferase [Hermetia illucens]|uniref:small RNA 2'-O-methyltransferase n=1 Tax=Hermetia illucens TaxID=343691 RepID=UPI0018CC1782|nr:small RNA 2'-O-methyltransferase [Hermetia illucens]